MILREGGIQSLTGRRLMGRLALLGGGASGRFGRGILVEEGDEPGKIEVGKGITNVMGEEGGRKGVIGSGIGIWVPVAGRNQRGY